MIQNSNGRLLLVDDDKDFREEVAEYLEDSGFELLQAANGKEALQLFETSAPEVIISDLHMPVMDGLELIAEIVKTNTSIPIIVVSGGRVMEDAIRAIRMGAWDFLTKPLKDIAVLEHMVCKSLERARLLQENKQYKEELEEKNHELRESLEILREDQEAARHVQQQLLPKHNVSLGKFNFDHSITPSLYLSGDFCDYFTINDNQHGFYIADVSGHGAPSAFVTVLLKTFINQKIAKYQMGVSDSLLIPKNLLVEISEELLAAQLGKYLTMVYGVIDEDKNELTYSIAGHFPNPILKTKNNCEYLKGNGFPVGVVKKAVYEQFNIPLADDCTLVLFSDGILEVMDEQELKLKEQALIELVNHKDISVSFISKYLSLEKYNEIPDDVTFMTVKRA